MSLSDDVVIVTDEEGCSSKRPDPHEEGVEVPLERINPGTLRNLIIEFVTREWEEVGTGSYTLDDKIGQVQRQLTDNKAKVVFDLSSNTANIIVCR